jgi:predicted dehydrogenase
MPKHSSLRSVTSLLLLGAAGLSGQEAGPPLRLAIAGLVHGHADGFFRAVKGRADVQLVGVFEPDISLQKKYGQKYGLAEAVFFTDLGRMLDATKPEAVAAFTSTYDHPLVVEAAAPRKIAVMMEKPLAVSMEHAARIARAAGQSGIPVIVNYETTWYPSNGAIQKLVQQGALGEIRKMVAMDGHQGPKEIGVGPEFFGWLTDSQKNGAGALFDFGCYGANLMTWLMGNERPLAVTAMTKRIKPDIYPQVDDEADILIEYPKAIGIVQASWNWPFGRKDLEVYGQKGYANATGGTTLRSRLPGQKQEETSTPEPLPPMEKDSVTYLAAVARGKLKPSGLSSLENNLIVTEILTAARESAFTGKRVVLPQNTARQYLFAYFKDPGKSGVHFAVSEDGYQWTPLRDGGPWLMPEQAGELMRDPFVTKGPDGVYHMVWTWEWRTPFIGHATSSDLVTWSAQQKIPLFQGVAGVKNVWAPEICWDARTGEWIVFWSTAIDGKFTETLGETKDGLNHRIYSMRTKDWTTFSEPKVFFNPGYSVIDATLLEANGEWRLIFKDERETPLKKFIQMAVGPSPDGPWSGITPPFTEAWSEGPSAIKLGDEYIVYYDHYQDPKGYRAVRSKDLKTWEDVTPKMSFPPGSKHGSFLAISRDEADRLRHEPQ